MAVPDTVYQGTTFAASIVCPQRPNTIWAGELRLTKSGEDDISLAGVAGDDAKTFVFTAPPADTEEWMAGAWNWAFLVSDGTDTFLMQAGSLTVLEINGAQTELEAAKSALADVRAALAQASGKVSSYSIKDRSLTERSINELITLEGYWLRRVNELTTSACTNKTGNRRITYGRFV